MRRLVLCNNEENIDIQWAAAKRRYFIGLLKHTQKHNCCDDLEAEALTWVQVRRHKSRDDVMEVDATAKEVQIDDWTFHSSG